MTDRVTLVEMGPRDGLQNEPALVPTAQKIALVDRLTACGFSRIEVTSFVSPKWVPQMADAAEVMAGITRKAGVRYGALTPNLRGLNAAVTVRADEVAVFASASEGFSQANINCSIAESLDRFAPVIVAASTAGVPVRGYISCVTDCPYDGPTSPAIVAELTQKLLGAGCFEISLGDTIGAATSDTVSDLLDAVLDVAPPEQLAGHFHDTRGRALANIEVCLARGLRVFDAAIGGLGGCPYAPGAKGNVATESVVDLLDRLGYVTDLDPSALRDTAEFARSLRSAP